MSAYEMTLLLIGKLSDEDIIRILKRDFRNIVPVSKILSVEDLTRINNKYYNR